LTQFKRGYKAEELESKICSGVGSHDMCDIGLPLKLGSSVNDSFILIHQMVVLLQFVDQFKININSGVYSTDSASIQKVHFCPKLVYHLHMRRSMFLLNLKFLRPLQWNYRNNMLE